MVTALAVIGGIVLALIALGVIGFVVFALLMSIYWRGD